MGIVLGFFKSYKLPLLICSFIVYSAIATFVGWKLNTYYTGYQTSIEQRIEKQVDLGLQKIQQQGAKNLKDTQDLIDNKQTQIIKEKVPLIVDRPIYLNSCLDEDGVDVLRKLRDIRKGAIK